MNDNFMAEAGVELDEIEIPEPAEIKVTPPTKVENGFTSTQPSTASLATEATMGMVPEQSSKSLMNGDLLEDSKEGH